MSQLLILLSCQGGYLELVKRGSIHKDVFFKVEHIFLALPGISRLQRHNIDHVTLRTARTDMSICMIYMAAFLPRLAARLASHSCNGQLLSCTLSASTCVHDDLHPFMHGKHASREHIPHNQRVDVVGRVARRDATERA